MGETSLLVVDDNSVALKELTDALKYLGCRQVQTVTSANEAWAMLRVKDYSGVFSAWDMPEMTGLALLRVVRSDEKHTNLPFFLSDSAFTKPKVLEAGMAGVSGLLVKPFPWTASRISWRLWRK
jgi:two-component system chemotaxis response regulator CheY